MYNTLGRYSLLLANHQGAPAFMFQCPSPLEATNKFLGHGEAKIESSCKPSFPVVRLAIPGMTRYFGFGACVI